MHEKIDLEKLVRTLSVPAHALETFDLSYPKPFENLVFQPRSQGGETPRFPDAAGTGIGWTLKCRCRPLPMHPGMKHFRKGNPAVDEACSENYMFAEGFMQDNRPGLL